MEAFWNLIFKVFPENITMVCVVVSAVSLLDLTEQFTPPETAPQTLVNLVEAIEKKGTHNATHSTINMHTQ